MQRKITEFFLYKHRYGIGYTMLFVLIVGIVVLAGIFLPGGLRSEEIQSSTSSAALQFTDFSPESVISLPYHLLQRLSFELFGFSIVTVKLPSIILAIVAMVGGYLLVREWFSRNVAIITMLISVTMPLFLFLSQDGTPLIFMITTMVWLLYAATMALRSKHIAWKIFAALIMSLNFYMPLGIYLNAAVISTAIFHPHVRQTIRRFNLTHIIGMITLCVLLLVPLLYGCVTSPHILLNLLGIPDGLPDFCANLTSVGQLLVNFDGGNTNGILHPVLPLGIAILIIAGVYRLVLIKYTARSYIIWLWLGILVVFSVLDPIYVPALYPLIVVGIALAIEAIIGAWYDMFPKNPYARVAGLIPLLFITIGLTASGVAQYSYSYIYSPDTRSSFSSDIRLLSRAIDELASGQPVMLVIQPDQRASYVLFEQFNQSVRLTEKQELSITEPTIVTADAHTNGNYSGKIARIMTNERASSSDRYYLYTAQEK